MIGTITSKQQICSFVRTVVLFLGPHVILAASFQWHIYTDRTGLPAAQTSSSSNPAAARVASSSSSSISPAAHSAALASPFSATVSQLQTKPEPFRVQLASSPMQLSSGSAYTFTWWAMSSNPAAELVAVLQNLSTNKTAAALKFTAGRDWSQQEMRFVQPRADGPYSWQLLCGASTGSFSFNSLEVNEVTLDSWSVDKAEERIQSIRKGKFQLLVVDKATGRALQDVTRLNLTLVRHAFHFGTAIEPEVVQREQPQNYQWYVDTVGSFFWSITPENIFKWFNYEPQQGAYQQAAAVLQQQYFDLAERHNMDLVRGHTLEWGKPYADCLAGKSEPCFWAVRGFNCTQYAEALKQRVHRDVSLFRGKFKQYDVINEFIEMPSMLQHCNLTEQLLPEIFRIAAAADPQAQLCVNEWDMLGGTNWQGVIELASRLQAAGAPLHCIGVQAHLTAHKATVDLMWTKLNQLAVATRLPLYISEFSLSSYMHNGHPVSNLTEDEQAAMMRELLTQWFSHSSVKGVTLWGMWDGHIWTEAGGIFRKDKTPKPAAIALHNLWSKQWNTSLVNLSIRQPAAAQHSYPAPAAAAAAAAAPAGHSNSGSGSAVTRAVGQNSSRSSSSSRKKATSGRGPAAATTAAGLTSRLLLSAANAGPCLDSDALGTYSFFFGGAAQLCGAPAPPPPMTGSTSSRGRTSKSSSIDSGGSKVGPRGDSSSSSGSSGSSGSGSNLASGGDGGTVPVTNAAAGGMKLFPSTPRAATAILPVRSAAAAVSAAPQHSPTPPNAPPSPPPLSPPPPPPQTVLPPLVSAAAAAVAALAQPPTPPPVLAPAPAPPRQQLPATKVLPPSPPGGIRTAGPAAPAAAGTAPRAAGTLASAPWSTAAAAAAGVGSGDALVGIISMPAAPPSQWQDSITTSAALDSNIISAQAAVATPAETAPAQPAALAFTGFYGIYRYEFHANQRRFAGTLDLRPHKPNFVRLQVDASSTAGSL